MTYHDTVAAVNTPPQCVTPCPLAHALAANTPCHSRTRAKAHHTRLSQVNRIAPSVARERQTGGTGSVTCVDGDGVEFVGGCKRPSWEQRQRNRPREADRIIRKSTAATKIQKGMSAVSADMPDRWGHRGRMSGLRAGSQHSRSKGQWCRRFQRANWLTKSCSHGQGHSGKNSSTVEKSSVQTVRALHKRLTHHVLDTALIRCELHAANESSTSLDGVLNHLTAI